MRISDHSLGPENPTLKDFQDLLRDPTPDATRLEAALAGILAEKSAEQALQSLNRLRPRSNSKKESQWHGVRTRLETAARKARELRIHDWQRDPNRRTLRLLLEIRHPASGLNPSALAHTLASLVVDSGFLLALGLEKKPRPMISLGPPLPLGVEGLREWADVVLQEPLKLTMEACLARLNDHSPAGLRPMEGTIIPNHSSALLDLAHTARWHWAVSEDLLQLARTRMEAFEAAASYEIEKTGKLGGTKTLKRLEVRGLITSLTWRDKALDFSTRILPGEGLSPVKLLAGILAVEPAKITHLTRTDVILGDDPRLAQARKYETKLHNIFEDAVLLESGVDPGSIDEDDDELLVKR